MLLAIVSIQRIDKFPLVSVSRPRLRCAIQPRYSVWWSVNTVRTVSSKTGTLLHAFRFWFVYIIAKCKHAAFQTEYIFRKEGKKWKEPNNRRQNSEQANKLKQKKTTQMQETEFEHQKMRRKMHGCGWFWAAQWLTEYFDTFDSSLFGF